MLNITRQVITPYSPAQMYALVSDIANYKNYLPWCSKSEILSKENNIVIARVEISYLKISTHFITKNTNMENEQINMKLVEGPFKHLQGHWRFIPLGESGSKIEFKLDYEFSNIIIGKVIGTVFEIVIKNIVDNFVKKAHEIYRK